MSVTNEGHPPAAKRKGKAPWAAGAGILLLLSKLKGVLLFALKAGKPVLTMLLSIGAYALIYPWTFAVGFVLLIFVHEMGHVLAAKQKGLPVTAPVFIPFLGALIMLKRNPKDAETEAYIGMGGPVLGSVGAFVCYTVWYFTGHQVWYGLAYAGFFLNLLNLMPIHPLDGGRIVTAVSRWLWLVGVVAGPFIIWRFGGIIFLYIWLLFLWEMYKRFFRNRGKEESYTVDGEFQAAVDPDVPDWYLAGASHRRELPHTSYCRLNGEHVVRFAWEPLSFTDEMVLPQPSVVDKVLLTQIGTPDEERNVKFKVRVQARLFDRDRYYEVPLPVRIRMGLMYGGLMAVLFFMIWKMGDANLAGSL